MTDKEIVELFWARDEAAIDETKARYAGYLFTIAVNFLHDRSDAEEAVNDTYMAAWNSMPENRPEQLNAYLSKLIRRISVDRYRRLHAAKRDSEYAVSLEELQTDICGKDSVEGEAELDRLTGAIERFLTLQKQETRIAFMGRYFAGDSLKEIARYTGMSIAKLKTLLFRTRMKLRAYLESEGFEV